ncbi:MAG: tRNA modification GTPase [Bacteroidota bacterium]
MKKQLFFLLFTIISFNFYAQDDFEKGYFIDNNNQRVDCLIEKTESLNTPTKFKFKLSENADVETANITSVKEFGVGDYLKYIRVITKIDRSSENLEKLSNQRAPEFEEEELFLKVLVEGKANLYEYTDNNLRRFFYKKGDAELEQLVFKSFRVNQGTVSKNNRYRQQLLNELKCPKFTFNRVERVDYKKKNLIKYFTDYSECNDVEYVIYKPEPIKFQFNLSIRPRVRSTSVAVYHHASSFRDFDFGSKLGFGIGVEAEIILPFKKKDNKWAVIVEPTYYSKFEGEQTKDDIDLFSIDELRAEVMYSSVEIPIGVRRYFHLSEHSKIFANFSYALDIHLDSSFEITKDDGDLDRKFESRSSVDNFALGLGYKYNDKFSLEFRYHTNKDFLNWYDYWSSDHNTISVIFGYTLF